MWLAVLVLFGSFHARVAILGHEAAHRLLFPNKKVNDFVGKWLLSYPGFVPFDLYRRSHFAHHKEEFGPNEPDLNLYNGYPITRASFRRKLTRDAYGNSGWKNLKGLLPAAARAGARPVALQDPRRPGRAAGDLHGRRPARAVPALDRLVDDVVAGASTGCAAIAEHGGMTRSPDRRLTTHSVRQTWLARFWIVPYNTGWHLAHHVDMGVPWRNLPALHRELVASGWVTPGLEYPSYTALWRKLASRDTGRPRRPQPSPFRDLSTAHAGIELTEAPAARAVRSAARGAVAESGRSQSP